jgi:hypothetical protein
MFNYKFIIFAISLVIISILADIYLPANYFNQKDFYIGSNTLFIIIFTLISLLSFYIIFICIILIFDLVFIQVPD